MVRTRPGRVVFSLRCLLVQQATSMDTVGGILEGSHQDDDRISYGLWVGQVTRSIRVAPLCKGGRIVGKSLVDRFLEILGYAYSEVRHDHGLHSVMMRKHELQLELRWFVASNGGPMVGLLHGE